MGDMTLWQGDCRSLMAQIPDGSIDALVTDPPYGIVNQFGSVGTYRDRTGAKTGKRSLQFSWDTPQITQIVVEAITIAISKLKSNGAVFVFCGYDQIGPLLQVFREAGITPKPACWVKTCPPPASPGNWWPSAFEAAIYGYRPKAWFGDSDAKRSNVFIGDSMRHGQPGKTGHPTQKPLWIMSRIVKSICPPEGIVLDPFVGSGTTLVAAINSGRRAIGIELDPDYFAIAEQRVADARILLERPHAPLSRQRRNSQSKSRSLFDALGVEP